MAERPPMRCPKCGDEMNRHAEKVDYAGAESDPDGALFEAFACACGATATRPSAAG